MVTCYKCGKVVTRNGGRLCDGCLKPRIPPRLRVITPVLSFREQQIARLVMQANKNSEIATTLRLTEATVKEYLNRIFRKTQTRNRTDLALWTARNLETPVGRGQ